MNISNDKLVIIQNQKPEENKYWESQFDRRNLDAVFPLDYKGVEINEYNSEEIQLPERLSYRILDIVNNSDDALHVLFLAVIGLLGSKYSNQSDFLIGMPINFVNKDEDLLNKVLPIHVEINSKQTLKDFLISVKNNVIDAEQNSDFPIEQAFQRYLKLAKNRIKGLKLFDAAVLLENIHREEY
jgi:hypothetical protein